MVKNTTSHVSICSLLIGVQLNLSKKMADFVDKTLYQYKIISLEIHHYLKWLLYSGFELGLSESGSRVSRKVWR